MARLTTLSSRLGTLDTRTARPAPKIADPELLTPEHKIWRQEVLKRAGWKCQAPGCTAHGRRGGVRLYADHIVERRDGGSPVAAKLPIDYNDLGRLRAALPFCGTRRLSS